MNDRLDAVSAQSSHNKKRVGGALENIQFGRIIARSRAHWRALLLCGFIFSVLSGFVVAISPHTYAASAIIVPPPGASAGGFAMTALKSFTRTDNTLTAISDPQQRFQLFEQLLTGEDLAGRMLSKYDFKYHIYKNNWDPSTKTWHHSGSLIASGKAFVMSLMGFSVPAEPTPSYMASFISNHVSVVSDLSTGITTVEMKDTDAAFAQRFLATLLREDDDIIRRSDVQRLSAIIADLRTQLPYVTVQAQSDSLIAQIVSMQIQYSEAKVGPQYSFAMIQPPEIEDRIVSPRPILTVVLAFLVGLILAALFVSFDATMRIVSDIASRLRGLFGTPPIPGQHHPAADAAADRTM